MESASSSAQPPTSDPPFPDDWDAQLSPVILPASTYSDDVEALQLIKEEFIAKKNQEGEVIQHRAWKLCEAFRSEGDHPDETPSRSRSTGQNHLPPSSPQFLEMPSASSPIAYPLSSSPPMIKRRSPSKVNIARKKKVVGGFLLEEESDGEHDFSLEEPAPKRRMLEGRRCPDAERLPEVALEDAVEDPPRSSRARLYDEALSGVDAPVNAVMDGELDAAYLNPANSQKLIDPHAGIVGLPSFLSGRTTKTVEIVTCSGKSRHLQQRGKAAPIPYEQLVAARSTTKAGRAKKSYYGINIHQLIDDASKESANEKSRQQHALPELLPSIEEPAIKAKSRRTLLWTEKYRARNFMELVGDDRTHRQVLRWLKSWDSIVFPKSGKPKSVAPKRPGAEGDTEKTHRKILLLTGPPGLGKTTLAHVCARQAGYEVMEINASDERSRDVVRGRIRTSVGTESVKTGSTTTSKTGKVQKVAHPLCVVVDEVDGVVGGSGGSGEGGFVKALIDLILLDQKNSNTTLGSNHSRKKKGDNFRLWRPLILICNDVYHPSLRPLRQSSFAEIIHVRKPPLDAVVSRMKSVFEKEGVACDSDAVRRLCEATWGISGMDSRKGKEGTGEGDLRGIMVVGEWAARKLRTAARNEAPRLTRKWVEENMTSSLSHGGGGARGVGRGGAKEVVNRVFLEGAGFPRGSATACPLPEIPIGEPKTQLGIAEQSKRIAMDRLREMVDTSGDIDRIVTDIFSQYPTQPFNDDSIMSKPDAAYEWLHFHDSCSTRVFSGQDFELAPYLSQPVLACHHLFASPARHYFAGEGKKWGEEEDTQEPLPFSGPRADYQAHEAEKLNRATILTLQSTLNATLLRSFRSPEDIATDLLPYLVRMLTPDIKPIVVGGSGDQKGIASVRKEGEKAMAKRAVDVMGGFGVIFERGKLEGDFGCQATQWVYRMEPPLDTLITYETASSSESASAPVRYAVRQVLDQEYQKNIIVRENAARQARYKAGSAPDDADFTFADKKENKEHYAIEKASGGAKRDFFGRVISGGIGPLQEIDGNAEKDGEGKKIRMEAKDGKGGKESNKVWVSYHEGFSNAVRKPITVEELLRSL